jgi:hypothetical protein
LAFTAGVVGLEGEFAAGLVITAGLEAAVPGTFAGALLSVDLQLVVIKKRPKIKIPKMVE